MSLETHEEWQVESGDQVFSTNLAEMTAWIEDGSMLRIDRVRRGNLRWIEAGKVPTLAAIFDAREKSAGNHVVVTTTSAPPPSPPAVPVTTLENAVSGDACSVHADVAAAFECETCLNKFCRACPNSYGGNVKICPFCGAMCRAVNKIEPTTVVRTYSARSPFGLGDFVTALGYPFRFPAALIMGGIMFTALCVGRSGAAFGGMFMMWGSIACYLLSNTLTFGILANTVENFSQGKLDESFMPAFDNFSIWEDGVHPFFLMIGVNVVSFLPLAAVALFAVYSFSGIAGEVISSSPSAPSAIERPITSVGDMHQAGALTDAVKAQAEQEGSRAAPMGEMTRPAGTAQAAVDPDDEFAKLMAEAEAEAARTASLSADEPEASAPQAALARQLLRSGLLVGIGLLVAVAWGAFFFPAACAVAGYTRSLAAVMNVTVGLDTIRRLGLAYAKVVAIFVLISVLIAGTTAVLNIIFAPLDLPMLGNIPATAIASFISFYLSIVFSVVLGLALYKKADRLELPQA